MTLLRDLIHIPDAVRKGDFVMSLSSGFQDPSATLDRYVVTEQLAKAYDDALGFAASALREGRSKAAYLDGSFGAGKSHFMAVLHLLLREHPDAWGIPELAGALGRHGADLRGKRFDLVPVHMIGAESVEQRVFTAYLDHLARVDPDAPPPALFRDEPILEEARRLRVRQGDEEFFRTLNDAGGATAEEDADWGDATDTWIAASFEAAATAAPGDPERARLVGDLVGTHLRVVAEATAGGTTGWVDFDRGLGEIARHARARGNDGIVLFLDELILWLGTRMADQAFVNREGPKVAKLVEWTVERPVPVIAFVARQRDLRDFVDEHAIGAGKLQFADALQFWEGRFHKIALADRNLPAIASRRLLEPVDAGAQAQVDEAFAQTARTRQEVLQVLLTDDSDLASFRLTYPFSPAFVSTLVAASSVLQRERTALRVMLQLLVDRRDELQLGDVVGVGDLYDVLAQGDEPFSDDLRRLFEQAKTLYRDTLRPVLEATHGGQVDTPGFRADDRLVKTLLLAALVPGAPPLRALDVARLTALNHGTIRSPIPGGEKGIVLSKLRRWAPDAPALRVTGDEQNPTVEIRLTGVDVEGILLKAEGVDNLGLRRQLVKGLLFAELGITPSDSLLGDQVEVLWRGTKRRADVVFGNVRDEAFVPSDVLRASGDRWKVVLDFPFDEPGHTPDEDLERLDRWQAEHPPTRTVCWIPAFFSAALVKQVKRLALCTYVLEGERLEQYATDLSRADRLVARGILEDMRTSLEQRVLSAIRQAYGVERAADDAIDTSHAVEERLRALTSELQPQVPIGARLSDAFADLIRQMLDVQYPDHPRFEDEVKDRDVRTVWTVVEQAVERGGRIPLVPSDQRRVVRRIANPLRLGVQHEAPFELHTHWRERLDKQLALDGGDGPLSVGRLRTLLDRPAPLGLPTKVANLVLLTYAAQTGRSFRLHGGEAMGTVDQLPDELELVTAVLPSQETWAVAVQRAPAVFGLGAVNPALTPASVEALGAALRERARTAGTHPQALRATLGRRGTELRVAGDAPRLRTAAAADGLIGRLVSSTTSVEAVHALAEADVPTSEQALGASIASAERLRAALEDDRWTVLDTLRTARPAGGDAVLQRLAEALERDEFAAPLQDAVAAAYRAGVGLLAPAAPRRSMGRLQGVTVREARAKLDELPEGMRIDLSWTEP
jgi:hypothetical protein